MERYAAGSIEDADEMREAAKLMCSALTHVLAGGVITPGMDDQSREAEIAQTTLNVLAATLQGNNAETFGVSRVLGLIPAGWDRDADPPVSS